MEQKFNQTSDPNVQLNPQQDSWKEMFEHLSSDMTRLFQKESILIRTEVKEKIGNVKEAGMSLAVGASLLLVGLFALVATAIILLDIIMPLWASAVIVTMILLVTGGVLLGAAKKKLEADKLTPHESIETLSEIKNTFKERINEFKHHH